jgi:hypothetical protein
MVAAAALAAGQHAQEADMAFSSIVFEKFVDVFEDVDITKDIDVDAFVFFNTAMGSANAEALGQWTHTETLTESITVQGLGSESASESVSVSQPAFPNFLPPGPFFS